MAQQRSSGMMAHLPNRPPNLDELEHIMLPPGTDPASPIAEAAAPEAIEVSEVPMQTAATEAPKAAVPRSKGKSPAFQGVLGELTATPVFRRNKVALNSRVDDWIDTAIDGMIRRVEEAGFQVTKEDIVVTSLIRGLNLTPPAGWTLR